jgi:hypothetical protein
MMSHFFRDFWIWNLGFQLTLFQPVGQIMPTALLLAHPDLKNLKATLDSILTMYAMAE